MKLRGAFQPVIGALTCVLSAGCDSLAPASRPLPINLTDRRGEQLTALSAVLLTKPVWSPDGSRVYVGLFNTLDPQEHWGKLHAIDVAAHTDEVLTDTVPLSSVGISAVGGWVYFTAYTKLSRIPAAGGAVELVRDSVDYFHWVSTDGRGLVYGFRNDVWVVASESAAAARLPPGTPLAYSPRGDEMLYCCQVSSASGTAPVVVTLATGAMRSASVVVNRGEYWRATRWDQAGFEALIVRWDSLHKSWDFLARRMSGVADTLLLRDSTEGYLGPIGWSSDGTHVGFWKYVCLRMTDLGTCVEHWALYVADRHTGIVTWVAGADGGGGCLYFSPDGRRVVYVLNEQLYLSDVP